VLRLGGQPPEPLAELPARGGLLLEEPAFRVRAALLDHDTPCLGFAIEENMHVNVWKNRLEELGVQVGPWLQELKREVLRGAPDDARIRACWDEGGARNERWFSLGELKAAALYLDILFAAYNDPQMVLAEYNGGPTNARRLRNGSERLKAETRDYVVKVMGVLEELNERYDVVPPSGEVAPVRVAAVEMVSSTDASSN